MTLSGPGLVDTFRGNTSCTFADSRVSKRTITNIVVSGTCVEEAFTGHDTSYGVRVYRKGTWGFANGVDPSAKRLALGFERAVRSVSDSGTDRNSTESPPIAGAEARDRNTVRLRPLDVSIEEKVRDCLDLAKAADNRVDSLRIFYKDVTETWLIRNSYGADVRTDTCYCVVEVIGRLKQRIFGFIVDQNMGYEIVRGPMLRAKFDALLANAKECKKSVPIREGEYDVVLDPYAASGFVHEAVGHLMESGWDSLPLKLLGGKGTRVASADLFVSDNPAAYGKSGSYRYDHEGTLARQVDFITGGKLNSHLRTTENALVESVASTGNARCQSARYPPLCRVSNMFVKAGSWTTDELLEPRRPTLFAQGIVWASVDDLGNFLLQPQFGWRITKADTFEAIQIPAIRGHVKEHLRLIEGIGKNPEYHAFLCSREDQRLRVSGTSPAIKISRARIIKAK